MRYGRARRNGRSRACGASRFPRTCRSGTASPRSARPTAQSRMRSSARTSRGSTITSATPSSARQAASPRSRPHTNRTDPGAAICAMATSPRRRDSLSLLAHPLPGFLEEPGARGRRFENLDGIDAADLIDRNVIGGGALGIELAALGVDLRDQRAKAGGLRLVAHHGVAVEALADRAGAARRIERAAL